MASKGCRMKCITSSAAYLGTETRETYLRMCSFALSVSCPFINIYSLSNPFINVINILNLSFIDTVHLVIVY